MSVRQKLGVILGSKVLQKLSLEKKFLLKMVFQIDILEWVLFFEKKMVDF